VGCSNHNNLVWIKYFHHVHVEPTKQSTTVCKENCGQMSWNMKFEKTWLLIILNKINKYILCVLGLLHCLPQNMQRTYGPDYHQLSLKNVKNFFYLQRNGGRVAGRDYLQVDNGSSIWKLMSNINRHNASQSRIKHKFHCFQLWMTNKTFHSWGEESGQPGISDDPMGILGTGRYPTKGAWHVIWDSMEGNYVPIPCIMMHGIVHLDINVTIWSRFWTTV
jgi:hypothetical protein